MPGEGGGKGDRDTQEFNEDIPMLRIATGTQLHTALALILISVACRQQPNSLPQTPPHYRGQISGQSFDNGSSGRGQLTLLRLVPEPGAHEVPAGFARIDGSTKFVSAKGVRIDWNEQGLPELRWAHVRVWFHAGPTSLTAAEAWGNAQLVVIDSTGTQPLPH